MPRFQQSGGTNCSFTHHAAAPMIGAAMLVAAGSANAQATSNEASLYQALRACATLSADTERLACYDRIAGTLSPAAVAGAEPPSPEQMFGASRRLSRGAPPETATARELLDEISARVVELREHKDGSLMIELDNGQIWIDVGEHAELLLRTGDTVTISRAALGTFRLTTPTDRSARVRRVR